MPLMTFSIANTPLGHEVEKNFQPYAAALGRVVYSWNNLHDALADLFWCVTGVPNGDIPLACWNAIESDRAQRKMLRVATEAKAKRDEDSFHDVRVPAAIIWLISEVETLANRRNDAIHSPYRFFIMPGPMRLESNHLRGHPRAKNLKEKELLSEFKWYWQTAEELTRFTRRLILSISNQHAPWPDKPTLPTRGQKKPSDENTP